MCSPQQPKVQFQQWMALQAPNDPYDHIHIGYFCDASSGSSIFTYFYDHRNHTRNPVENQPHLTNPTE